MYSATLKKLFISAAHIRGTYSETMNQRLHIYKQTRIESSAGDKIFTRIRLSRPLNRIAETHSIHLLIVSSVHRKPDQNPSPFLFSLPSSRLQETDVTPQRKRPVKLRTSSVVIDHGTFHILEPTDSTILPRTLISVTR